MDPGVAEAIAVLEVIHSVTDHTDLTAPLSVHNPDDYVAVVDRLNITASPLPKSPGLG